MPPRDWLRQPGGIGERLMRLRTAAGLTGEQLSAQLGWARAKASKIENGWQLPSVADITAWAEACGQPSQAAELIDMLGDAQAIHRQWLHRLRAGHVTMQEEINALVRDAAVIRNFEVMVIPGFLQTPDYARYRIMEGVRLHGADPDRVEETVAARMRRTDYLYDTGKRFEFIITEAALGGFLLCPPEVMAGQLDRLQTAIGLSNVTLGVIPRGRVLEVAPMVGFLMIGDVTLIETYSSVDTLRGEESASYGRIADTLMGDAVTGDEVRTMIMKAAAALG